jgi:vacuolar protein sorting-associated protein 11|tara:strand:+ start:829 stop:1335 length:507 start_codon:yes stop_codon:yes gene_type:complete
MKVCTEYAKSANADPSTAGDMWIQALTYFRDHLPSPDCEISIERALSIISDERDKDKSKEEILSPLLVLEILQSKPNLKFKVIKKYLLNRLEVQDRIIRKNNKAVDANMEKIKTMRNEIHELKTQAKNFNQKKCPACEEPLTLPTIHFMCGHTYHDTCIDADNGKRHC